MDDTEAEPVYIDAYQGWKRLEFACAVTGLKRSWFYPKMKDGSIRGGAIKDPEKNRGLRMVYMPSLKEYIEANIQEDNGNE